MIEKHTKKGFTLVELSIVLVVISLIVGGIIGGKALIRSSELSTLTSKLNEFKTMFNTFQLQYDAWPGDMLDADSYWTSCSDAAGNTCNGDGDGIVEASGSVGRESYRAWQHLSLSEILPGSFDGLVVSPIVLDLTAPRGLDDGSYFWIQSFNIYSKTANGLTFFPNGVGGRGLTGKEARSLDKKTDDGSADSGKIVIFRSAGTGCVDATYSGDPGPASADFVLSSDEANCAVNMWLN